MTPTPILEPDDRWEIAVEAWRESDTFTQDKHDWCESDDSDDAFETSAAGRASLNRWTP